MSGRTDTTPAETSRGRAAEPWLHRATTWLRLASGGALLIAAAVLVMLAADAPGRRAHVLPHQGRTDYEIHVFSSGRSLTSHEVAARYRIPFHGLSPLTPEGLKAIVRWREGRGEAEIETDTFVRMHLRLAGKPEQVWLWPEN